MKVRRVLVWVFVLTVVSFTVMVQAQTERATLSGRVVDPTGAAIVGASVTITDNATNASFTAKTSGEGLYTFPHLVPGHYRVRIEREGFKTLLRPDLVLHVQDVIALNFGMTLGSRIETVTVTSVAPLVNTESATVSTVVDRQLIENLPLNGRSFQSLLMLTPGVVAQAVHSGNLGQFSVNGQRADSNYVTLDGVSANFGLSTYYFMSESLGGAIPATNVLGGYSSLASVDALQEFRIQTSTYAPEYGRQPGGQVSIVTRSGTNAFHGTLFEYLRNDVLDARDYFNVPPQKKPPLRQNDFGGVIGGPIIKDKAFFFFSYEALRLRKPQNTTYTVPSLALRASALPDVQPLLNMFPLPTPGAPVNPDGSSPGSASWSDPGTVNAYSVRVDANLRKNLTLFGRYNYSPSRLDARGGGTNGLSALSEIVLIESSQILHRSRLLLPPDVERESCILQSALIEIVGVEDERLAFGVENTPERPGLLAGRVGIDHVDNMEVAGPHEVADVAVSRQQLVLALHRRSLRLQLVRQLNHPCLETSNRGTTLLAVTPNPLQLGLCLPQLPIFRL